MEQWSVMDLMVKFQLTDLSGISSDRYGSFLGIFITLNKNTILVCRFLWNSHTAIRVKKITLIQGCTNIPNMWMLPPNSRCHDGDIKQIPSWKPTNIRCYLALKAWHMGFEHSALLIPKLLYFLKNKLNDM
jgi:hypothetical protein